MNCPSLLGSVVIPLLRFCCILLEAASFSPASPVLEFSVRSQSHGNKGGSTALLWEDRESPEKSLRWWCWCISCPGPERPCQPKTVSSPRSLPELQKKIRLFRDKCLNGGNHLSRITNYPPETCPRPPRPGPDLFLKPRALAPPDLLTSYPEAAFSLSQCLLKKKKKKGGNFKFTSALAGGPQLWEPTCGTRTEPFPGVSVTMATSLSAASLRPGCQALLDSFRLTRGGRQRGSKVSGRAVPSANGATIRWLLPLTDAFLTPLRMKITLKTITQTYFGGSQWPVFSAGGWAWIPASLLKTRWENKHRFTPSASSHTHMCACVNLLYGCSHFSMSCVSLLYCLGPGMLHSPPLTRFREASICRRFSLKSIWTYEPWNTLRRCSLCLFFISSSSSDAPIVKARPNQDKCLYVTATLTWWAFKGLNFSTYLWLFRLRCDSLLS